MKISFYCHTFSAPTSTSISQPNVDLRAISSIAPSFQKVLRELTEVLCFSQKFVHYHFPKNVKNLNLPKFFSHPLMGNSRSNGLRPILNRVFRWACWNGAVWCKCSDPRSRKTMISSQSIVNEVDMANLLNDNKVPHYTTPPPRKNTSPSVTWSHSARSVPRSPKCSTPGQRPSRGDTYKCAYLQGRKDKKTY